jgi:hypothetical protein
MTALLRVIAASVILAAHVAAAAAQPDALGRNLASGATLRAHMEHMMRELPAVWRENLLPAIEQTFDDPTRAREVGRWTLEASRDFCRLTPRIISDRRVIEIGASFILLSAFHAQAIVFHLLDIPAFSDPAKIVEYTETEIGRSFRTLREASDTGQDCGMVRLDNRNIATYFGMSEQDYLALQRRLYADAAARSLGDHIGGLGVFFVVLHEAGHVWFEDGNSPGYRPGEERRADGFAIDVLRRSDMPPSLAIMSLSMLEQARAIDFPLALDRQDRLPCRIATLVARDDLLPSGRSVVELRPYLARAERLRQFWQRRYAGAC